MLVTALLASAFCVAGLAAYAGAMGASRNTIKANQTIVAETILEWEQSVIHKATGRLSEAVMMQRSALNDESFKAGHVLITKQFDGTPMDLFISKVASEKFSRFERPYGACICGVEVMLQRLIIPNDEMEGLTRRYDMRVTSPPVILQSDTASNILEAIAGDNDVSEKIKTALSGLLHYLVISLSSDSASSNLRAMRLWHAKLEATESGDGIQVLLWLQRCDGHYSHLIIKLIIRRCSLLSGMFSLAHQMRRSDYRAQLLKGVRDVLAGDPPPEYRDHWKALFDATLLRGVRKDGGGTSKVQKINAALLEGFHSFVMVFNGPVPVGADSPIVVYSKLHRLAMIELMFNAVETLFFLALPGVPAESRWTTFAPFVAYLQKSHSYRSG